MTMMTIGLAGSVSSDAIRGERKLSTYPTTTPRPTASTRAREQAQVSDPKGATGFGLIGRSLVQIAEIVLSPSQRATLRSSVHAGRSGNAGCDYRRVFALHQERAGSHLKSLVLLTSGRHLTNVRREAGLIFEWAGKRNCRPPAAAFPGRLLQEAGQAHH